MSAEPPTVDLLACEEFILFWAEMTGIGHITLVAIEPDGPTATHTFAPHDNALPDWIRLHQSFGRNVYYQVNETVPDCVKRPGKREIVSVLFRHADIDPDVPRFPLADERDRLLRLADFLWNDTEFQPTAIIDSGGGINVLWATQRQELKPGGPSNVAWETIDTDNRMIEYTLRGKGAYNFDRCLRLPGTINFPNAKKKRAGRGTSQARLIHAGTAFYIAAEFGTRVCAWRKRVAASGLVRDAHEQPEGTSEPKAEAAAGYDEKAAAIAALIPQLHAARIDLISGPQDLPADLRNRLGAARAARKTLDNRWHGKVDDLSEAGSDASRSGVDFSLAAMLKAAGFDHIETGQMLCAFQHGTVASGELSLEAELRYLARCVVRSHELPRPFGIVSSPLPESEEPNRNCRTDTPLAEPEPNLDDANAKPDTGGPPEILTAAAFMATFKVPDYVIDGIIQRGSLYALTSPTGHGKTAVALYMGCMVVTGGNIGNIEVTRGAVIFLVGENPDDFNARLHAACQEYGLEPADLLLYVLPATFPMTAETAETLKHKINALGCEPALIVVDTAAAFFPGDNDNDNVQAGAYARTLRVLTTCKGRPAVLTPAHPVKNPDKDNLLPRGGGAFLNELDGNLSLWSQIMGEAAIMHWQGKIRGPDFAPVNFAFRKVVVKGLTDSRGRPLISVVAILQTDDQAEAATTEALSYQNTVLVWLRRNPGMPIAEIARKAGWVAMNGTPHKGKVHRLLKTLQRDKLVTFHRGKWRLTDAGKKELKPE